MPRYKLSPEERVAEQERKENLRNIIKGLKGMYEEEIRTASVKINFSGF